MAVVLQEVVGVDSDDTGLIGLGDISKDNIDHADQHAVLVGMTGILDDRDDVGALLGHVDQIASRAVRELDSVDKTLGSDNISNVGDSGSVGSSEVEDLLARGNVDVINTSENTGSDLGAERVPDTVLNLGAIDTLNGDSLLTVDGLAGDQVLGQEVVLLSVSDKDTLMSVGLDGNLGTTLGATAGTAATATGSTASTATTTAITALGNTTTSTASTTTVTAETTASTATAATVTAETTATATTTAATTTTIT